MLNILKPWFSSPLNTRDRFAGCLLGQALGDALGFIVEGYEPEICASYVRKEMCKTYVGQCGRVGFAFGQYSDDSQLARELLESYVSVGFFEAEDYARRIAAIFRESRIVGRGQATENAARRLQANIHWMDAGEPAPSAGNGSAMRAGPIGLLFYDTPEQLIQAAHEQGYCTHHDPRCSAGSIVIAFVVGWVLRYRTLDIRKMLSMLAPAVAEYDPLLAKVLSTRMSIWLTLSPDNAIHEIQDVGVEAGYNDGWQGISPFVTPSVLWSLYAFLRSPDNYWETVCTAIVVGGDVDTTAAMAVAMSGAWVGVVGLPKSIVKFVTDCETWEYEGLCALAERAYELKHR